jgi:integrase
MGQGSVYQRPGGLWAAQILVDGRRRSVSARTQQECVAKLDQLKVQAKAGLPAVNQRVTVTAYLTHWLEGVSGSLRPSTATRYGQIVKHQLIPHLGRARLAHLQPADVQQMLSALGRQGLSPQTQHHARAVLRASLNDALATGAVARNVAAGKQARPPRVPYKSPTILSPEQVRAMLHALPDPAMGRIVTVAVATGLRQGELLGLRWSDIADGQLHIHHALQRVDGRYQLVEPKSTSSRRSVPLTPDALTALEEQRRAQRLERLAAPRWREPIPGLIFTTATGQPRNGTALTHQFEQALAAAGLPAVRFHDLRHAFAGLMLASGVELAVISHLLGHSSVSLTASTYAGVAPSLRSDAADLLGRSLQQPV